MALSDISRKLNNMAAADEAGLQKIDVDKLVPSKFNFYGIRNITELAEDIKKFNLHAPLVVADLEDGNYEILSGERRWTAVKQLGWKKVLCKVFKGLSDADKELILIQANAQTREINTEERMKQIKRLEELIGKQRKTGELPKGKKTRDLIGEEIGMSGTQVGRYQRLEKKLIPDLKEELYSENITITEAETLSALNKEDQKQMLNTIKTLNPKENKEEIKILIDGIKQDVSKKDKEILKELDIKEPTDCNQEDTKEDSSFLIDFNELIRKSGLPKMLIVAGATTIKINDINRYSKTSEGYNFKYGDDNILTIDAKELYGVNINKIDKVNLKFETCIKLNIKESIYLYW